MAREHRRLAAIVAADVVGYSRLMGRDESGTLAALKALRREVVDPKIDAHNGRIVKTTGDGLLLEFPSVVDAVRCVIEVQTEMAARGANVPEDRRITFRIGVNLGDVIVDGDDLFGDGVNVAARLEALAEPGGLCLSEDAVRQVGGKVEAAFNSMGVQSLKNIAQPVTVWRWVSAEGSSESEPLMPLTLPDKPSIAVLPFQNMSGDPEQEYFADGISEDIITELTRFRELFVIARNSSFSYKGKSPSVRDVGRELGVRYVLEGSVRRAGNRIRLTGQLVDTQTDAHIWAERYDRQLDDVFLVQEELTRSIVRAIAPQISETELAKVRRRNPTSLSAYELAVRANATALDAWTRPELRQEALRLAEAALALDPASTMALGARATARHQQALLGTVIDREAAWRDGVAATERMLELDRSSSSAYAWKGLLLAYAPTEDRIEDALASARQGHDLNPHDMMTLVSLAYVENMAGSPERAIELTEEALRISPRDPLRPYLLHNLTMASFAARRYAEAIEHARRGIVEAPELSPLQAWLAASYVGLGQYDQAKSALAAARRAGPKYVELLLSGNITAHNPDYRARVTTFMRIAAGLENPNIANPALALPDKPSIAVLPFQNMSGDPEQEYFTDGMVEDIITALSRFKALFVIARNSSFIYKGKAVDIKQVGRELGVRYVLEGSVRKAANRLRISGQLIDATTGGHLWADHFDGVLEDVFELQDRVTSSVVGAIAPKLERAEIERAIRKPTESLDAYDCFLRAMAHFHSLTRDSLLEARRLFRRATELDPTYAAAYGYEVWCIIACLTNGWLADPEREITEGVRLARRAVAIGIDDPVALLSGAGGLGYLAGELENGIAHVDRAILLNPNLAFAWSVSGYLRMYLGEHADAIERFEHAIRLSPLDSLSHTFYAGMSQALLFAGRYDKAVSLARKAALGNPNGAVPARWEAIACALSGRIMEAREALARMRAIDPDLRLSHLERGRGMASQLRRAEDRALVIQGLRKAGLPE